MEASNFGLHYTPLGFLNVFPAGKLHLEDSKTPLTDANEHWRLELDDWRALLAPFSWKNSRAPVMSPLLKNLLLGQVTTRYNL